MARSSSARAREDDGPRAARDRRRGGPPRTRTHARACSQRHIHILLYSRESNVACSPAPPELYIRHCVVRVHTGLDTMRFALAAALVLHGAAAGAESVAVTTGRGETSLNSGAPSRPFSALKLEETFSFELGGVPSSVLLKTWNKTVTTYPLRGPGNRTRIRTIYFQPMIAPAGVSPADCAARSTEAVCGSFGVQLIVEAVSYPIRGGHTGTEWSLEFRNTGPNATLPLCAVRSLNASMSMAHTAHLTVSAHGGAPFAPPAAVLGDGVSTGDPRFSPTVATFPPGATKTLGSGGGGRSSENSRRSMCASLSLPLSSY